MTIMTVYAAKGRSIPSNRLIRFTGARMGSLWEVDVPGTAGRRAHGVTQAGPGGVITDTVPGQVETFGSLVEVELESPVEFDDDLTVGPDGRARAAGKGNKYRSAVALVKTGTGSLCPVLLGCWSQSR